MMIKVSVQYNCGLLLEIILLTLYDYIGNTRKTFCPYSQFLHAKACVQSFL